MNARPFSRTAAEQHFGPDIVAAVRQHVAAAPPTGAERRSKLRALFVSARTARALSDAA